jgi:hypothetical protein
VGSLVSLRLEIVFENGAVFHHEDNFFDRVDILRRIATPPQGLQIIDLFNSFVMPGMVKFHIFRIAHPNEPVPERQEFCATHTHLFGKLCRGRCFCLKIASTFDIVDASKWAPRSRALMIWLAVSCGNPYFSVNSL